MAQLVKLTAHSLNGTAIPNTPAIAFPTTSIIAIQLNPTVSVNGVTCNSKVYVLGTNDVYYTNSTVDQIKDAANAALV